MSALVHDAIVIGASIGGVAAAYHLTQRGGKVLLVSDGWPVERNGHIFFTDGQAAWMIRPSAGEFQPDTELGLLGWPISHADLEPFYDAAERLQGVRRIVPEPAALVRMLQGSDERWQPIVCWQGARAESLPFLEWTADTDNMQTLEGRHVVGLLGVPGQPRRVMGVVCNDGSRFYANRVLLATGAVNSARLLLDYAAQRGLEKTLPGHDMIGRYYKRRLVTILLAVSPFGKNYMPPEPILLRHADFPHGSVLASAWRREGQLDLPGWIAALPENRTLALMVSGEDGSHPDNRIRLDQMGVAVADYAPTRSPALMAEHRALCRQLRVDLLKRGWFSVSQTMPSGLICGTLAAGSDSARSVVDGDGRVHGMENLYVVDASALPRSGSVDPTLTVMAWGLRCASRMS